MTTKFSKKAFHLVLPFCKSEQKEDSPDDQRKYIKSIKTQHQYMDSVTRFLEWLDAMGQCIDGPYSTDMKQEFIYTTAEVYQQTQLDTIRQALELVFKEKLIRVKSERPTILLPRSYQSDEVAKIMRHQTDWNALSTAICFTGGLRSHELPTLTPFTNISQIDDRPWNANGFAELRAYKLYVVKGKGGLRRRVAIPAMLVDQLETRRLEDPWLMVSRETRAWSKYAIGGGQAFSQSFSSASQRALGFSNGAHGLRHSYAKTRLKQLLDCGRFSHRECMCILSQELGHFRPEITMIYLR